MKVLILPPGGSLIWWQYHTFPEGLEIFQELLKKMSNTKYQTTWYVKIQIYLSKMNTIYLQLPAVSLV